MTNQPELRIGVVGCGYQGAALVSDILHSDPKYRHDGIQIMLEPYSR